MKEEQEIVQRLLQAYNKNESPEMITREYRIFRTKKSQPTMIYERLAQLSGKIFKYPVEPEKKKEIDIILRSFDLAIEAEDSLSLSVTATIGLFVVGTIIMLFSILFGLTTYAIAVFGFFYLNKFC